MKVNAFTSLFQPAVQISKVNFKKSDVGSGPEAQNKTGKYIVHMSKLMAFDMEIEASSQSDAERKAIAYIKSNEQEINAKSVEEDWQIDLIDLLT